MSILITGMEMPTNCFLCPLSVLRDERLFCEVTKDEVLRAKRPSDCPLVPVPPHGRLIDLDAPLRFEVMANAKMNQSVVNIYAPVVIEAEEEI